MRAFLIYLLLLLSLPVFGQSIQITGPNRLGMIEGDQYNITWYSDGIKSVSLLAYGKRTPVGIRSRNQFVIPIAEGIPSADGQVLWTVPWIDSITVFIKAKGYDSSGQVVAVTEQGYSFRPAAMTNRLLDGIYLDLHLRTNQRLYVQKDYRIVKAYLSSSSEAYKWLPPNEHISTPHDHAGIFKVLGKEKLHQSELFDVPMPYAMRYLNGHFIHATSPNLYHNLGEAASHGCNRLTRYDARKLFDSTPIGTRVEVIGPEK